jgi:phage/plasmid-associated DNA primase
VIAANQMPRVKDADVATQRRIRVISFTHQPEVEDPTKKDAFLNDEQCLTALLGELIAGCQRAQTQGLDDLPAEFGLATIQAFDDLDDVREFIGHAEDAGHIVPDETCALHNCLLVRELHNLYVDWVRKHGDAQQQRDRLGIQKFNRRLETMGWQKTRVTGMRWIGYRLGNVSYMP